MLMKSVPRWRRTTAQGFQAVAKSCDKELEDLGIHQNAENPRTTESLTWKRRSGIWKSIKTPMR